MGHQKQTFSTWATNLPSYNLYNLSKKKKTEHSASECGEDKENIPEHAKGFSAPFNLPFLSLPIYQQPREISQASMGQSPRKELKGTKTPAGNQMLALAVSNLSNG